jgi:hypothetical protein
MTTAVVDIPVPQEIYDRLEKAAVRLEKSVPALLSDALLAVLPENETIPSNIQSEVAQLESLNIQELWTVARSEMSEEQQTMMEHLLYLQSSQKLKAPDLRKLEELRVEYGRIMLCKARAFAILAERGQSLPIPEDDAE